MRCVGSFVTVHSLRTPGACPALTLRDRVSCKRVRGSASPRLAMGLLGLLAPGRGVVRGCLTPPVSVGGAGKFRPGELCRQHGMLSRQERRVSNWQSPC